MQGDAREPLMRRMGILGIVSFVSFLAAVLFAPRAYPGYDWLSQAVSDLSAQDAPSLSLWNRLASLNGVAALSMLMVCCVYVQGRLNRETRLGVYLYAAMMWVSAVGYVFFPLTTSGFAGTGQDTAHLALTGVVVLLSIASMVLLIVGGLRGRALPSLAAWAALTLALMFTGAIGTMAGPKATFGLFERFSVLSSMGFTAVLGVYLMLGFPSRAKA
ncbi:MAG TPA: DUF998 domain-containing protein [Candidatus Limnocylindria bacterium]|nr:DUF998 domain-containing protein [Candidatus Limnocylindria bacterium]